MLIRSFESKDQESVVALWESCGLTRPWNDPNDDIERAVRSRESEILVTEIQGQIVASAMVGHDGHRGWMYYVAVDPNRRDQGLGRAIVEAAEAWLTARSMPKSMLMVRSSNLPVIDFYAKQGYKASDVVVLEKWLVQKKDGST